MNILKRLVPAALTCWLVLVPWFLEVYASSLGVIALTAMTFLWAAVLPLLVKLCFRSVYANLRQPRQAPAGVNYAHLKRIAHALGLRGTFPANDPAQRMRYEGNYPADSLNALHTSVDVFFQAALGHTPSVHLAPVQDPIEIRALQVAYNTFRENDRAVIYNDWRNLAARYKAGNPVMINCNWRYPPSGHYSGFLLYQDKLYSLNRPYFKCYRINTQALLNKTVAGNHIARSDHELAELLRNLNDTTRTSSNFADDIAPIEFRLLQPSLIYSRWVKPQNQGNCSYTNRKKMVEVVYIALKEEAMRLQAMQGGQPLTESENALLAYQGLNPKALYKKFSTFDRYYQIDQFINQYKQQAGQNAIWDPLLRFLREKTQVTKPRSVALARYIVQQLKQENILASDELIAAKIAATEDSSTFANTVLDFSNVLAQFMTAPTDQSRAALCKLRTMIFSNPAQATVAGLQAAGLSPAGIAVLRTHFRV